MDQCITDIDIKFIRQTIDIAKLSVEHGNQPFGALLADKNGNVLILSENMEITTKDKTCHAEKNLVSEIYLRGYTKQELSGMTMYTSTEPCVMCTGALVKSGIGRIVYGCSAETMSKIANGGSFNIPCSYLASYSKHPVVVVGPVIEDEAKLIHIDYWPNRV